MTEADELRHQKARADDHFRNVQRLAGRVAELERIISENVDRVERADNPAPYERQLEAENAELRADAERWRAFISSDRFYVMGWCGFTNDRVNPQVDPDRDPENWLHFTLNVWDRHPAGEDELGTHGRALLLAYVEHLRAERTACAS